MVRARAGLTWAAAVTARVVTLGGGGGSTGAAACGGGGAGCGSVCTGETPAGARWRSNASTLSSRRCSKLPNPSTLTSATTAITGKASASATSTIIKWNIKAPTAKSPSQSRNDRRLVKGLSFACPADFKPD